MRHGGNLAGICRRPSHPRSRRRYDGSGRAAFAVAFRRTLRTRERSILSDGPCASWADHGAPPWRLYHHLFSLALDFLDQCADLRHRPGSRDRLRQGCRGRSHLAARRERLPSLRAWACQSLVRAGRRRARPHALGSRGFSGRLGRSRLGRLCCARAPNRVSAARSQASLDQNFSR